MTKRTSRSKLFGDFCFREPYTGLRPSEIRRQIAAASRASIARSVAAGIAPGGAPSPWPWLKQFSR